MKREKFSPTIESNDNGSKLALLKSGLGKKAAALLIGGSLAAGLSACDDNESTPVSSETVETSEIQSSTGLEELEGDWPLGGKVELHPYPELSKDALKITERYGDITNYPPAIDYTFIDPQTGDTKKLENIGMETVEMSYFDEYAQELYLFETEPYLPQIDEYIDAPTEVEVNGTKYDVDRIMTDSLYLDTLLDPKTYPSGELDERPTNKVDRMSNEIMTALGLSQGDIIDEYIKAESINNYGSNLSYLGEKEYKVLDENATDQEILDNYDIEIGILSSIDGSSARTKLAGAVVRNMNILPSDSDLKSIIFEDEKANPYFEHHKAQEEYNTGENIDKIEVLGTSHAAYNDFKEVRIITAYDSKKEESTPQRLIFAYWPYGGGVGHKWVNISDDYYTDKEWSDFITNLNKNSIRQEILGQ